MRRWRAPRLSSVRRSQHSSRTPTVHSGRGGWPDSAVAFGVGAGSQRSGTARLSPVAERGSNPLRPTQRCARASPRRNTAVAAARTQPVPGICFPLRYRCVASRATTSGAWRSSRSTSVTTVWRPSRSMRTRGALNRRYQALQSASPTPSVTSSWVMVWRPRLVSSARLSKTSRWWVRGWVQAARASASWATRASMKTVRGVAWEAMGDGSSVRGGCRQLHPTPAVPHAHSPHPNRQTSGAPAGGEVEGSLALEARESGGKRSFDSGAAPLRSG